MVLVRTGSKEIGSHLCTDGSFHFSNSWLIIVINPLETQALSKTHRQSIRHFHTWNLVLWMEYTLGRRRAGYWRQKDKIREDI